MAKECKNCGVYIGTYWFRANHAIGDGAGGGFCSAVCRASYHSNGRDTSTRENDNTKIGFFTLIILAPTLFVHSCIKLFDVDSSHKALESTVQSSQDLESHRPNKISESKLNTSPKDTPSAIEPSDPTELLVFLSSKGKDAGPFRMSELRQMLRAGSIPVDTIYWHGGLDVWQPIQKLDLH